MYGESGDEALLEVLKPRASEGSSPRSKLALNIYGFDCSPSKHCLTK